MDMPEVGNYVESHVTCVNDVTVKRDGADCNGSPAYFKEIKNEKKKFINVIDVARNLIVFQKA